MNTLPLRVALVGNPNCGKTALFNRLTGSRAKVANYAGVTVEKRVGPIIGLDGITQSVELIDLPGTYSLFVASPDEQVARQVILGEMDEELPPDVLVAVVDATNLRLGLRLVLELQTLGRPMLLALNLADAARQRGIQINRQALSAALGMPVVETIAIHKQGDASLRQALSELLPEVEPAQASELSLKEADSVEQRYAKIEAILANAVQQNGEAPRWQDQLDSVVLHPVWGLLVLLTVLLLMFQAVFAWAQPLVDGIESSMNALGGWVGDTLPPGILQDFLVNGVIAGSGSVLAFLPQIVILFGFILALEDSGYLPRAAFLLDRLMRGIGLSGRSFIPLLSSFACAVPGIMATRSVQDPRERLVTIMIAPLMTCSARLPVYALIIGAFIPEQSVWGVLNLQGLTLLALYLAGIISAALIAWLARKRQTRTENFPLLLELPNYRWPNAYHFFTGLKERAWIFLRRVGTVILAMSVILWFLASFPLPPSSATQPAIEYSFAGQFGQLLQPLFEPLGFSWQMSLALIPAMAAREVAVSALATVYAVGGGEELLGASLGAAWSLPSALAFLAWFVYAPQCLSTIAVVRRETNSLAHTLLFVAYQFGLAYLATWLTFHLASRLLGL